MGHRPTAYLAYGIEFEEGTELPWRGEEAEDYDEIDDECQS